MRKYRITYPFFTQSKIHSSHCHSLPFSVPNGDIVVETGAAEGIFFIEMIDKVSKIYLFECNSKWNKALQKTFKPYGDKVVIINERVDIRYPLDSFLSGILAVVD